MEVRTNWLEEEKEEEGEEEGATAAVVTEPDSNPDPELEDCKNNFLLLQKFAEYLPQQKCNAFHIRNALGYAVAVTYFNYRAVVTPTTNCYTLFILSFEQISNSSPKHRLLLYISFIAAQVDAIRQAMAGFSLPPSSVPGWAKLVPEEVWKSKLIGGLQQPNPSGKGRRGKK